MVSEPSTEVQRQRRETLRPHPARDQIIDALGSYGEPISPAKLAQLTGRTLGSIAYHVRTLHAAGVVELAREGRARGAVEHFYALVPDHATDLVDPLVQLQRICEALTLPSQHGELPVPVALDPQARDDLQSLLDQVRPKVRKIVRAAAKRAAADTPLADA
jgi:DNA-binding transcriptional ArsR family regulator